MDMASRATRTPTIDEWPFARLNGYDDDDMYAQDDGRGLRREIAGRSSTVTSHGVPLLSYTRTINRFYSSRKQKLSLYRFKCEVCGEQDSRVGHGRHQMATAPMMAAMSASPAIWTTSTPNSNALPNEPPLD